MANTIPADLVDEVISNSALQAFSDTLTPASVFGTDFSDNESKTFHVPSFAADASQAFAGNYTSNADTTVTDVTGNIDQHEYVTVHLTDIESANSSQLSLEKLGVQAGIALAKGFWQNVLSAVTAANYSTAAFTGASSGFDSDDVIDIKDACDDANMPAGRGLVLANAYYNQLLKDSSIKNAQNYGSDSGIQAGMIPNLVGFRVFESGAIPGNSENLVGFACTSTALALGMRYLRPQAPEEYLDARPLSDPETGVVIGLRRFYLPDTGAHYLTLECNYGFAVGQAAALKRLVSA